MRKFIPYGRQWVDKKDVKAVVKVLQSDFLAQGPQAEKFEKAICKYTGARFCVVVSSGTAALHLAVAALNIKKDSEGITSPITFVASANCLLYNGLKPVFADIDPNTYNIDPDQILKKINRRTRLIIPVHFAGQPADMKKIRALVRKNNIYIIEDAAHAIGSKYEDGTNVGNCRYSNMTIFSFHPVKTITTGEGGAITTNDEKLYKKLILLRSHGITKDEKELKHNPGPWYYEMQDLGYNYRLTDIQAVLGISQIKKLDWFIKRRRQIVKRYNEAFSNLKNIKVPYEKPGVFSAFHLYVLAIDFDKFKISRKEFMEKLKKIGIGTQVHYIPVHLQPYYQNNFDYKKTDFPVAESFYKKTLSIPLFPKMKDSDVRWVIKAIQKLRIE